MNLVVYCEHCRREFPDYRRVGQHIKDQVVSGLSQLAGTVPVETYLGMMLANPVGGVPVKVGGYEVVMEFSRVQRAFYGSRRDALNAAQVPCQGCGKFSRWTRGEKPKRGLFGLGRK